MSVDPEVVAEAARHAEAAAAAAGVELRMADPGDMKAIIGMFERTWGPGRSPDRSMLLAMDYAGSTVLIATAAGKPVGATLGFLGWSDGLHLHSHMAAVVPWRRSGGVGYALKLFQRAVCLENEVTEIRWTFDPLIRRNAHFNLVKLGAEVVTFLPDFYGRLDDVGAGSDRSDRLEVRWRLDSGRVGQALAGRAPWDWSATERLTLNLDFERLRIDDQHAARLLRAESRLSFHGAMARGLRPELNADNDYVFTADAVEPVERVEPAEPAEPVEPTGQGPR